MENEKTLKTEKMTNLQEISESIFKLRKSFYLSKDNTSFDFIYSKQGIKSINCDYSVAKYALAQQLVEKLNEDNTEKVFVDEYKILLNACIKGVKNNNMFINENDEELLNLILKETKLSDELVNFIKEDAVNKYEQKIPKMAKAAWLSKMAILVENEYLKQKDINEIKLCMFIVNQDVKAKHVNVCDNIGNILKDLFEVKETNLSILNMSDLKSKTKEISKNQNVSNEKKEKVVRKENILPEDIEKKKQLFIKNSINLNKLQITGNEEKIKTILENAKYATNSISNYWRTSSDNLLMQKILYSIKNTKSYANKIIHGLSQKVDEDFSLKILEASENFTRQLLNKIGG